MRRIRLYDNWMFWKEGNEERKTTIQIPHDAMISENRIPNMEDGSASAYFPGGKYYYSRKIFGKSEYANSTVLLEFEGVYMDSTVLLNGEKVGGWYYGYTNFFVDLSDKLKIGQDNEIVVIADNSKTPNARWYTGSGIYRPVNLWVGGRYCIRPQTLQVKTVLISPAIVEISSDIENADVSYEIFDGELLVATASGKTAVVEIPAAKLWDIDHPFLYTIKATVCKDGTVFDEAEERFGIRMLSWSAQNGLQINGKTVKLKGGCIHHDNGILGACAYKDADIRKIRKMKEFGFNAIRFSHYPAGKDFLDACDELGMYVMDESFDQWWRTKSKYDYANRFDEECEKDLAALADKDFNHPCVIMYCIGNEIAETGRDYAPEIAKRLVTVLKNRDGTRPVTIANNGLMSIVSDLMQQYEKERDVGFGSVEVNELLTAHPEILVAFQRGELGGEKLEDITGKVFDELDIAGHNYAHQFYEGIHKARPDRIILSAETLPQKMASNWRWVMENDHIIGDFQWTAWDYLGEAGVGLPVYGVKEAPFGKPYPCLTAACGSFDLIGNPEAAAFYTSALWGTLEEPYIGVRPVDHSGEDYTLGMWRLTDAVNCWSWENCEGKTAEIIVYSAGSEVMLLKNGTIVDKKKVTDCKACFETPYVPGILEAVAYDEMGKEIARSELRTASNRVQLSMKPEKTIIDASVDSLVFIPIQLVDSQGTLQMNIDKEVSVQVSGEGILLALGSARPENEEPFSNSYHTTWHGSLIAVIRSTGKAGTITVTAHSENCESVSTHMIAT